MGGESSATTGGTDNRLAESRERVGSTVIQKRVKISRLSGTESVMGLRDKFEFYALPNRKPMNMFYSEYRIRE